MKVPKNFTIYTEGKYNNLNHKVINTSKTFREIKDGDYPLNISINAYLTDNDLSAIELNDIIMKEDASERSKINYPRQLSANEKHKLFETVLGDRNKLLNELFLYLGVKSYNNRKKIISDFINTRYYHYNKPVYANGLILDFENDYSNNVAGFYGNIKTAVWWYWCKLTEQEYNKLIKQKSI